MQINTHLLSMLKWLAALYVLVCAIMWVCQRQLIYLPRKDIAPPEKYGLTDFSDIRLKTADGVSIQAWLHAPKPGFPLIVYFHGNGGHLGYRAPYYRMLADAGYGLLAVSYRGYGASEGKPSEEGFYNDARAAMNLAIHDLALQPEQIMVYGESIGTGVAMQMACEFNFGAMVLQSPFTSLRARAQEIYPWLPVRLLLKDRYDSLSKASRAKVAVLLMHGEQDDIVPVEHGRALFDALPGPKFAIYFPGRGHNDLDIMKMTQSVVAFTQSYLKQQP